MTQKHCIIIGNLVGLEKTKQSLVIVVKLTAEESALGKTPERGYGVSSTRFILSWKK